MYAYRYTHIIIFTCLHIQSQFTHIDVKIRVVPLEWFLVYCPSQHLQTKSDHESNGSIKDALALRIPSENWHYIKVTPIDKAKSTLNTSRSIESGGQKNMDHAIPVGSLDGGMTNPENRTGAFQQWRYPQLVMVYWKDLWKWFMKWIITRGTSIENQNTSIWTQLVLVFKECQRSGTHSAV